MGYGENYPGTRSPGSQDIVSKIWCTPLVNSQGFPSIPYIPRLGFPLKLGYGPGYFSVCVHVIWIALLVCMNNSSDFIVVEDVRCRHLAIRRSEITHLAIEPPGGSLFIRECAAPVRVSLRDFNRVVKELGINFDEN
jgi:hypothetical protein